MILKSSIFLRKVSSNLLFLQIIEPSKEIALQLLESGRQNLQTRKLGIEKLRQLCLHHEHVNILLQDGRYLESLRYARKNKVPVNILYLRKLTLCVRLIRRNAF